METAVHEFNLPETENTTQDTTVAWNVEPQWNQAQFLLRDQQSHNHYCDLVEGDVSGRGGFSTTYGVNNRSVLLDLPLFDVTKCLPFDIMHSLFEGVSTHLLNQLFHHLINDEILGLDEINQEVNKICLGYSDSMPASVYYRDGRS